MNILLSSVGRENCMIEYFRDASGKKGKVYASNHTMTYALTQADGFIVAPYTYDQTYTDSLIDYCISKDISAIISLSDIDLPALAKRKEDFAKNNISVVVSGETTVDICSDKWKSSQFLASIGLKHPKSYIDMELLKQDIRSGSLSFPIIMKPRWGADGIGITRIDTFDELDVFYRRVHRQIFDSYLKYMIPEGEEDCIVMQEMIEGDEYILSVFNDLQGSYVVNTVLHKIVSLAAETNIAQVVDSSAFENIGTLLSSNLKHIANMDVDCLLTESGEIVVIEMNCRLGRQYPFVHLANVDFPKQMIEWLQGKPTSSANVRPEIGTKGSKESPFPIVLDFA